MYADSEFNSDKQETILYPLLDWELLVDDKVTLLINDFLPAFLNILEDILSRTHKPNPFVVGNRIPRSDLPGIVFERQWVHNEARRLIRQKRVILLHTKIMEPILNHETAHTHKSLNI